MSFDVEKLDKNLLAEEALGIIKYKLEEDLTLPQRIFLPKKL